MTAAPVPSGPGWMRWLVTATRAVFALTIFLMLLSTTWHLNYRSVFADLPLAHLRIGSFSYPLGLLMLLPLLIPLGWLLVHLLERPRSRLRWGPLQVTLPLLGFGLLILVRLGGQAAAQWVPAILSVCLLGGVYFFIVQTWPTTWAVGTLALLTLIQGAVGTLQFVRQRSVGLTFLGEPSLFPTLSGASVIESGGQRWLRAYGLTPHPDVLGGYLGMGFLVCLGAAIAAHGWRRWALCFALAVGGIGLFFSFSRSAWLGTLAGLVYLLATARPWGRRDSPGSGTRRALLLGLALLGLALVLLALAYRDLLVTRLVDLNSPLEKRSLQDRLTDARQAWGLIRGAPLYGVGPGRYREALLATASADGPQAFRVVHNTPLLIAAELGIPGALLWLWLVLAPPILVAWESRHRAVSAQRAGWAAAFLVAAVLSLFHFYLYAFPGWWPALYFYVLVGVWAREQEERVSR